MLWKGQLDDVCMCVLNLLLMFKWALLYRYIENILLTDLYWNACGVKD